MRPERASRAQRRRKSRVRTILSVVSAVVLAVLLFLTWPQSLGGRVAYIKVSGHSMEPTLHLGDLVIIRSQAHYHRGEVVAYHIPSGDVGAGVTVIHRIVGGDARRGFVTRGDNNHYNDPWHPRPSQIAGVRWGRLPGAATIFSRLRGPVPLAAFAALLTMVAAAELLKPRRRPASTRAPISTSPATGSLP
jgi:signal peptidase I